MKKVAITVVGVLTLAASANAQGTWYTDYTSWYNQLTTLGGTANYNGLATNVLPDNPYTELGSGVTVEATGALWGQSDLNSIFIFKPCLIARLR